MRHPILTQTRGWLVLLYITRAFFFDTMYYWADCRIQEKPVRFFADSLATRSILTG